MKIKTGMELDFGNMISPRVKDKQVDVNKTALKPNGNYVK